MQVDKSQDFFRFEPRLLRLVLLLGCLLFPVGGRGSRPVSPIDKLVSNVFDGGDLRLDSEVWIHVAPIEVISGHRGAIVACNDSIHIDHGHNFEN